MAGKFGSSSVFLLVDGYNLISAKPQSLRHKFEAITEKTDGLGDAHEAHTPVGMTRFELEQGGAFFDTDTNNSHAALSGSVPSTPQATARVVCVGFAGQTLGEPFVGISGLFSFAYEVLAQKAGLTKANVSYQQAGTSERGTIVQPLATKTADWNTKSLGTVVDYTTDPTQRVIPITSNTQANPTVITTPVPHGLTSGDLILIAGNSGSSAAINGQQTATVISTTTFSVAVDCSTTGGTGGTFVRANSSGGAAGYQQVTAFSGFTGFVGKLRDSADDSSYADLITFDDVTSGPNAQRKTVSGTVDRYMSFDGDVTGSGSITAFAGICRL